MIRQDLYQHLGSLQMSETLIHKLTTNNLHHQLTKTVMVGID